MSSIIIPANDKGDIFASTSLKFERLVSQTICNNYSNTLVVFMICTISCWHLSILCRVNNLQEWKNIRTSCPGICAEIVMFCRTVLINFRHILRGLVHRTHATLRGVSVSVRHISKHFTSQILQIGRLAAITRKGNRKKLWKMWDILQAKSIFSFSSTASNLWPTFKLPFKSLAINTTKKHLPWANEHHSRLQSK